MTVLLFPLLFLAAVTASMVGQGGGIFYTPIQVWLGVGFHQAATTSLFLIMALSLSASLTFRKAHEIDWGLVAALELPTTLGAFLGGRLSRDVSEEALSLLLAALLMAAAWLMIRSHRARLIDPTPPGVLVWRRMHDGQPYGINLLLGLPIMAMVGLVTGMTGIGGGVLKVPVMNLLFKVPMPVAIGSSAAMVGVTATGGFIGHVSVGHWDWRTSLVAAVAVFIGAQIGSRLSVRVDKERLKTVLGWFLLAAAAAVALRAAWPG